MGLTIDLPQAGLLGIAGAQAFEISSNTTLGINDIYVLKGSTDFTITLPTSITQDGATILVKKVGTATVTVASAMIEGSIQTLTITNNQPVRFVYINSTFGWLIS